MNGYNFTERLRRTLAYAREEAARLHHEYVGTEHILLGLLLDDESVALSVLENSSIDRAAIRQKLEDTVRRGKSEHADRDGLPYTSRAKKVLELAMTEARGLNHNYVGTEHVLLGLLREEKGIAAQVLTYLGLTLDAARAEVVRELGTPTRMNRPSANVTTRNPYAPQSLSSRERIIAQLRGADAVSPASARSLSDLRCKPDVSWQSLVDEGLVREGPPGMFYLYERTTPQGVASGPRWKRFAKTFAFWILILLLPIIIIQFTGK